MIHRVKEYNRAHYIVTTNSVSTFRHGELCPQSLSSLSETPLVTVLGAFLLFLAGGSAAAAAAFLLFFAIVPRAGGTC